MVATIVSSCLFVSNLFSNFVRLVDERPQDVIELLHVFGSVSFRDVVRSGHERVAVRGACGLVEGIITQRRVMPENGRSWWPKHVRKNCVLGRNLQVQQNLQVQRNLLALQERGAQREPVDEQPQPQPDLADSEMAMSTETPDAEMIRRTRIVAKRSDPGELKEEVPKRLVAYCDETVASTLDGHGYRVRAA